MTASAAVRSFSIENCSCALAIALRIHSNFSSESSTEIRFVSPSRPRTVTTSMVIMGTTPRKRLYESRISLSPPGKLPKTALASQTKFSSSSSGKCAGRTCALYQTQTRCFRTVNRPRSGRIARLRQ